MKVIVNFANIWVAVIMLLLGLSVLTRHRIASYVVGGFIAVVGALSILAALHILVLQGDRLRLASEPREPLYVVTWS